MIFYNFRYNVFGGIMPFKIDSAIMKLDEESGKYDLVDPDGKFNKKDALMVVNSDDFITMQLVINAIIRNDYKAWKDVKWDDGDSLKAILVKLGYNRDEIIEMLKEF